MVLVLVRDVQRVRDAVAHEDDEAQDFDGPKPPSHDRNHEPGEADDHADHGPDHEGGQPHVAPRGAHGAHEAKSDTQEHRPEGAGDDGFLGLGSQPKPGRVPRQASTARRVGVESRGVHVPSLHVLEDDRGTCRGVRQFHVEVQVACLQIAACVEPHLVRCTNFLVLENTRLSKSLQLILEDNRRYREDVALSQQPLPELLEPT
mmetsp:Transcript_10835/g.37977  ORF Transcript_10835/g.37977 Transcript_10835/m.37977 type:complete len:204 (+) Transcript_10835:1116-1727(+)